MRTVRAADATRVVRPRGSLRVAQERDETTSELISGLPGELQAISVLDPAVFLTSLVAPGRLGRLLDVCWSFP